MPATHAPLLPHLGARWAMPVEVTAQAAFARLETAGGDVVWLDSSSEGAHIVGVGRHVLVVRDGRAELDGEPVAGDAVAALEAARAVLPGAWVGWFGYESGVRMLGLEPSADVTGAGRFPEAAWLLLERWVVVVGDEAQLQSRDGEPWMLEPWMLEHGPNEDVALRLPSTTTVDARLLHWRDDDAAYGAKVERCREHIHEGDSYVLCLTTAIEGPPIDPIATHARLRSASPVHHGGLLRIAGVTVSSASPETFLRVEGGVATTRPIKGTRRRGVDADGADGDSADGDGADGDGADGDGADGDRSGDDAALALELFESEKERAENVMIVDLCRNDLQRVCAPGTVEVTSLLAVETYPTVHQLVSTVRGRLLPELGPLDAVRALFPAGSMTGAPKRRTVELLQALEGGRRGVYSGCFGLVAGETCQLAMVIRSVVADEHGTHIGVGGGVTALSEPAFEVDELHVKAAALLASLVPR